MIAHKDAYMNSQDVANIACCVRTWFCGIEIEANFCRVITMSVSHILAAKVTLSHPIEVEGDWECCWFDSAHQHFLLLNDSYFYLLSNDDVSPTPRLFAHIRDLPPRLLCAKISLDKKFVAIQTSLTGLVIVDTASKKKWLIEIRHPSDNAILSGGIIWSEHGGNSEDLVLATSKGLELYKISQVRGQCKLSRTVSQTTSAFWYNSEHRMIMVAAHAPSRYGGGSRSHQSVFFTPDEKPKEMLLLDGFFLNCEKSGIPMLELPPPDKVPRLEVGPGLTVDDVSLVSLYGKVLCLVRYVEHGLDFITVYHMTKLKAERLHCLSLDCPTNGLLFSVYDNLLICHCIGERASVVFDIHSSTARSTDGISSSGKTHPLGTAAAMHYIHKHRGGAKATSTGGGSARNSSVEWVDCTASQDGRRSLAGLQQQQQQQRARGSSSHNTAEDGGGGHHHNRASKSSTHKLDSTNDDTYEHGKEDVVSDWGPLVTPQKRPSRLGHNMMLGGKREADISNFESLTFAGELSSNLNEFNGSAANSLAPTPSANNNAVSDPPQYMALVAPQIAQEVYSTYTFEYLAPNKLFDTHRKIVWEINCSFPDIVREMSQMSSDSKEIPLFLSRRGQRFFGLKQCAEGQLEYHYISREGRLAKQLMLSEMYSILEQQRDLATLKAYFRSLMRSYGNEYRRLIQVQFDMLHVSDVSSTNTPLLSGGTTGSSGGSTIFHMSTAQRRKTLAEGLMRTSRKLGLASGPVANHNSSSSFGHNMGVYPGLLGIAGISSPQSAGTSGGWGGGGEEGGAAMDSDTLELSGTMQLLLPDISMVGVRARKMHYLRQQHQQQQQGQSSVASQVDSVTVVTQRIKPTCQSVVLHTRRDALGCLICTQAELLSHVWLPLLLNSDTSYEYCAWALSVFIAQLRESSVTVAPAVSSLLLNVLFHSHKYVEVSRLLQQRALPDSVELALYSLEFCDMLQDHIENTENIVARGLVRAGGSEPNSPGEINSSRTASPTGTATPLEAALQSLAAEAGITVQDGLLRNKSALHIMRQSALDVLWRLDDRVTVVRWHLSHAKILEAIAFCKKKNGNFVLPLVPGSIAALDFFHAAVTHVTALQAAVQSPGAMQLNICAKEVHRAREKTAAVMATSVTVFHTLYLFLKEWDNAVLLATMVRV